MPAKLSPPLHWQRAVRDAVTQFLSVASAAGLVEGIEPPPTAISGGSGLDDMALMLALFATDKATNPGRFKHGDPKLTNAGASSPLGTTHNLTLLRSQREILQGYDQVIRHWGLEKSRGWDETISFGAGQLTTTAEHLHFPISFCDLPRIPKQLFDTLAYWTGRLGECIAFAETAMQKRPDLFHPDDLLRDDRPVPIKAQSSPSARSRPAKRDSKTEARDKWMYGMGLKGMQYKAIMQKLGEIAEQKKWELIETPQGIAQAIKRYTQRHSLKPLPSRRQR